MVEVYKDAKYPLRDLTGQRFGNLTVEEFAGRDINGNVMWRCRCDCGKEKNIQHFSLINGRSKSCGCRYSRHNPKLEGKRFGKLEVIKESRREKNSIIYLCRCDCGKELELSDFKLKSGLKSCGCLVGEKARLAKIIDLKGKKFNHLTVEERAYLRNHRQYWKCRCDCGKEVIVNTTELKRGFKKSCESIECKYSLESINFKGRLPNWYLEQRENHPEEIDLFKEKSK